MGQSYFLLRSIWATCLVLLVSAAASGQQYTRLSADEVQLHFDPDTVHIEIQKADGTPLEKGHYEAAFQHEGTLFFELSDDGMLNGKAIWKYGHEPERSIVFDMVDGYAEGKAPVYKGEQLERTLFIERGVIVRQQAQQSDANREKETLITIEDEADSADGTADPKPGSDGLIRRYHSNGKLSSVSNADNTDVSFYNEEGRLYARYQSVETEPGKRRKVTKTRYDDKENIEEKEVSVTDISPGAPAESEGWIYGEIHRYHPNGKLRLLEIQRLKDPNNTEPYRHIKFYRQSGVLEYEELERYVSPGKPTKTTKKYDTAGKLIEEETLEYEEAGTLIREETKR